MASGETLRCSWALGRRLPLHARKLLLLLHMLSVNGTSIGEGGTPARWTFGHGHMHWVAAVGRHSRLLPSALPALLCNPPPHDAPALGAYYAASTSVMSTVKSANDWERFVVRPWAAPPCQPTTPAA